MATLTAAKSYRTLSGLPLEPVYGPDQAPETMPQPGEFPYTRGIHQTMYRGKLWTMRQFAGFATAEETNARFHYLLSQGQMGLSVAFDLPTLIPRRSVRSANAESRFRRSPIWKHCSRGFRSATLRYR